MDFGMVSVWPGGQALARYLLDHAVMMRFKDADEVIRCSILWEP
jgi:hypothetical protein